MNSNVFGFFLGTNSCQFGLSEQRVSFQEGTFVPESLQGAVQSSGAQLLIEDEKIETTDSAIGRTSD
jgi:hypothetical protein